MLKSLHLSAGTLVVPESLEQEPVFYNPNDMDPEFFHFFVWEGSPAVVVEDLKSFPYGKIKILTPEGTGWIYTDYVKVVE